MSTQARVGIFTLLALVGAFATYYFISNFALRHSGYQIAVHFHDVGGLQDGSSVLVAGVQIGQVTQVELLPDQTVDVICTINPGNVVYRDSIFMVSITITGQTTLNITPPLVRLAANILPQHPLPENEQPWGTLPPTLADLVTSGQAQLRNLDKTLEVVNKQLPGMLVRFTAVADDTDKLVVQADEMLGGLSGQLGGTVEALGETVRISGRNLDEMTGNVNDLVASNKGRLSALADNLTKTSANLNRAMEGIASIASDPLLHESLVGTAANVEAATAKLKAIATEIEGITGDPNTQAELRGAIANLSAASAKADDILGHFSSAGPTAAGVTGATPGPHAPQQPPALGSLPGFFGQPLVQAQVRETWGTHGGGPASDVRLTFLPASRTHITVGADDVGYSGGYDVLVGRRLSRDASVAGGVLYSRLGLMAMFWPFGGPIGVDARVYDPKHPTLDLYGDLRLGQRLQLFYGERSMWGPAPRAPSFGLQVDY